MNEEMLQVFKDCLYSKLNQKFRNVSIRCYYPDGSNALKVTIYAGDFRYCYYLDYIHERISRGMTAGWVSEQIVRDFQGKMKKFYFY